MTGPRDRTVWPAPAFPPGRTVPAPGPVWLSSPARAWETELATGPTDPVDLVLAVKTAASEPELAAVMWRVLRTHHLDDPAPPPGTGTWRREVVAARNLLRAERHESWQWWRAHEYPPAQLGCAPMPAPVVVAHDGPDAA